MDLPELRLVHWQDSTHTNGWQHLPDVDPAAVSGCITVGYVIHEDDRQVHLAQSIDTVNDNVADIMTIPKVAITKTTTLRKPRR